MSSGIVLAKRKYKPSDMAMDHIALSLCNDYGVGNYVLVHYLNHTELFGDYFTACYSITDLNDVKSALLNKDFNIDWDTFNIAMEHLNVGMKCIAT